jgi:hypothetical protein
MSRVQEKEVGEDKDEREDEIEREGDKRESPK